MKRLLVPIVTALALSFTVIACTQATPPAPAPAAPKPAAQPAQAPAAAPAQPAAAARQPVQLRMLLSTFGTAAYNLGFALTDIAKKQHPWLRISPGESPGFFYNIKAIENPSLWENTIIGTCGGTIDLAKKGDPMVGQQITGVRSLFTYSGTTPVLATLDPKIKSAADLKGKRIAVGLKTQVHWAYLVVKTLEFGYGITEKDADIQYLGTVPAKNALLDGRVDAAAVGFYSNPFTKKYLPSPPLVELLSSPRPVYHIPWGKEEVIKTQKAPGGAIVPVTIPAGTIPSIKESLDVWTIASSYGVKDVFPEEYAYEVTKLALKNVDKFVEYDAQGAAVSPEMMAFGWTVNTMHPGAVQAFKESGITIPEK